MDVEVPDIENLFRIDGYLKPNEHEIRRRYVNHKHTLYICSSWGDLLDNWVGGARFSTIRCACVRFVGPATGTEKRVCVCASDMVAAIECHLEVMRTMCYKDL